jgi:hypothetical protein
MTAAGSWHDLRAGDQIGNLEYLVDEAALIQYRRVVGADGCFPNLMADDCRAMLDKRGAGEPLVTVWQRFDFLRPPIIGRRVQVGGWIREVGEKCGRAWLRAAAFEVDEIGTEILRSEAAFIMGREAARPEGDIDETAVNPGMGSLAQGRAGDSGHLGELQLPGGEQRQDFHRSAGVMTGFDLRPDGHGLTWITAGWLEGLMGADFGDDFRWGGRLSVAHHAAVIPGMRLSCDGVVISHDIDASGVEARRVAMSVRDAAGRRVATAEAAVKSPSPRLV